MSEPPESLNATMPVEETGNAAVPLTPPVSPIQPRSFLEKLFNRRRSADSADVVAHFPVGGEVESRWKQEVQRLRSRVKELEDDYKQLSDCKQKVVEDLMMKCTAEEEGRRKAEVLLGRSDEALIRAEEARRRAEERWRKAEDNLHVMQLQKNQVESAHEHHRQCGTKAANGRMWQQEQAKLRKENEDLRTINVCLERENEEYAEEAVCADMELKSLRAQIHRLQAQLDALPKASLERQRQHNGARGTVWRKDSPPLHCSDEVIDCKVASLEVSCVLQCSNGEAQRHLRTFYRAMDTSSVHAAYMSGNQHRDWRCLAEHVGLHEEDLRAINSEKRVRIIFDEWSKKESVTVTMMHQVLTKSQCTRAAECLLSAAQSMVEQEEGEDILDLGAEAASQSC